MIFLQEGNIKMFRKNKGKAAAVKIICPKCGKAVSAESVKLASEKSRKKLENAMKELGTINIKKDWEIKCGSCGKKFLYNPYDGKAS